MDCIVVYKYDRLTRSLADFLKLLEILDRHHVTFVAVTQPFNTTDIGGPILVPHAAVNFAQFERETICRAYPRQDARRAAEGEVDRRLPNLGLRRGAQRRSAGRESDGSRAGSRDLPALSRSWAPRFRVLEELERRDWRMKAWTTRKGVQRGGSPFTKTTLHALLTNVVYIGKVKFEGKLFDGEHEAHR